MRAGPMYCGDCGGITKFSGDDVWCDTTTCNKYGVKEQPEFIEVGVGRYMNLNLAIAHCMQLMGVSEITLSISDGTEFPVFKFSANTEDVECTKITVSR